MKKFILLIGILLLSNSLNLEITGPFSKDQYEEMDQAISDLGAFMKLKKNASSKVFLSKSTQKKASTSFICNSCLYVYSKIQNFLFAKYGFTFFKYIAEKGCSIFEASAVCDGAINAWADIVIDNLIAGYFNPNYVCSGSLVCDTYIPQSAEDFAKDVLKDKPAKNLKKFNGSKKLIMMQMTDVHADIKYEVGTLGKCDEPTCCRKKFGYPQEVELQAGKYGFVGDCDLPKTTIINFLDYAQKEINPDFIIWTGDAPSHDVYASNKEEAIIVIDFVTKEMKSRFNVPVYPAIGNHEFYPADNFDFFNPDVNKYTFHKSADAWKDWLGEEAYNSYRNDGFYTKKHVVNGTETNLRIIALNSMDCDVLNFNLFRDPSHPIYQFQWLRDTLEKAEKANEVVYIIGHIPTGDSTYTSECSKRYNALSDRFQNIILGHFFGHTHNDEFRTIRGYFNKTEIVNVVQTAPSLTTWPSRFPEFRTFEVDADTFVPIDYVQYYLNLTTANANPDIDPVWEVIYRATEQYGLTSIQDYEGYQRYIDLLLISDPSVMNKTINTYFGMAAMAEQYFGKVCVSQDLGCRFGHDYFDEIMKCYDYTSYNSGTQRINYVLAKVSGSWYKLKNN